MLYRAKPVLVFAHKIVKVEDKDSAGSRHLDLEDGHSAIATAAMTARYEPVPGDYFVIQADGYAYLNPKEVFERKYEPQPIPDAVN